MVLVGASRAPSTLTTPPEIVEPPWAPPDHRMLSQSPGNVVNSLPTVGARATSPFVVCEIASPVPSVPAVKSATVVSVKHVGAGVAKLAGEAGCVALFFLRIMVLL